MSDAKQGFFSAVPEYDIELRNRNKNDRIDEVMLVKQ